MPGAVLTGDSAGFVNVPKLKGIHYAMRSGMLAAEAIYEQLQGGRRISRSRARSSGVRPRGCESSHIWSDLHKVRNMRQALGKGYRRWAGRSAA